MKIEAQKLKVLVVGVPRSGTTLISNLINSADNGFCLSEPHHEFKGSGTVSLDKIKDFPGIQYDRSSALPVDGLTTRILNIPGFDIGGFKETYRGPTFDREIRNDDLFHRYHAAGYTLIGIIRDPVRVWNSVKSSDLRTSVTVDAFIQNYLGVLGLIRKPIVYENFLIRPEQEFLDKTGLKITGKIELRPTKFKIGDGYANTSASIMDRRLADITVPHEKLKLEPLRAYYRTLRDA